MYVPATFEEAEPSLGVWDRKIQEKYIRTTDIICSTAEGLTNHPLIALSWVVPDYVSHMLGKYMTSLHDSLQLRHFVPFSLISTLTFPASEDLIRPSRSIA